MTRNKTKEIVNSLVGAFEASSTVCLHLINDVLYPVLFLAILASGCRWTGTNTAYTASELEHHFCISETRYVIVDAVHLNTVRQAIDASGCNAEIILFSDLLKEEDDAYPNGTDHSPSIDRTVYRSLHKCQREQSRHVPSARRISPDDIAALMQTSGTTGKPKLVIRSHRGLVLETMAIKDNHADKPYQVSRLIFAPIFHGFTFPVAIDALRLGIPTYVMKRYDPTFAPKIRQFGITETFVVPAILLRLVENIETHPLVQSLRFIGFGGTPLLPDLRQKTLDMFKVAPRIVPVYGETEAGWLTTLKYPDVDDGSVGNPTPGLEMKIRTEGNGELEPTLYGGPRQHTGELLVRGTQLMEGYYRNAEASEAAFLDGGWLKTGDIVSIRDGRVYFIDRCKAIIKVNGFQVSPTEIEATLIQSADVVDVAVLGVGQGIDEHPVVFVVPGRNDMTEQEIKSFLRTRLAGYKVSRCEVRFMAKIARNSTGKVLRGALKEHIEARG